MAEPSTTFIHEKSWTMTLAGHMACMEGEKMHTEFWWENLKERHHLQDLGIDGRILLKQIFKK
jgi:hypothetical protein